MSEDIDLQQLVDEWKASVESIELAPLMVHTVTIGRLSYSWEDYAPNINVKADLRVALASAAIVHDIRNVIANNPWEVIVEFTTFHSAKYKGYTPESTISATISVKEKDA